jgi:serpin B
MFRYISILIALLILTSLGACSTQETADITAADTPRVTDPDATESDLRELASGNSAFAFDLYRALADNSGNIFFSPYSISAALAMTYAGAETVTEEEMADVLNFTLPGNLLNSSFNLLDLNLTTLSEADTTFSLNIINTLWGQEGHSFLPEFLEVLAASYGAGISYLDFSEDPDQCRETINAWVLEQTSGRITDLLPSEVLTTATKLVLTNAIYFKAQWFNQFDEAGTYSWPFVLLSGEEVEVQMMTQTEHFRSTAGDGYRAVELPYSNRRISMLVIVPDEDRFSEIEERMGNELIDEINCSLRDGNLYLIMPRFETVSTFRLQDVLSAMGMPSAFGMSADFSGMDGTRTLYISSVIHKAFITVDEKGTEAAAATAVVMEKMNGDSAADFFIDRPFIYIIRDNQTGTVLFAGRILNPLE